MASAGDNNETRRAPGGAAVDILGFVLYLTVGYIVLVSGLVMPAYAVVTLGVIWFVGLYLAVRWRKHRNRFLALPFIMFGIVVATAYLGGQFLGWTA
jgi:hypothetical protein